MTIKRVWHGWTAPDKADAYENLLKTEIFPEIKAKRIPGYRGIELLRRDVGKEVEFITVMTFDSLRNVIAFQGEDYQRAYVPDAARKILARWDEMAVHFQLREWRTYAATDE